MIDRLTIRGFRNLREQAWSPSPGRNLVLGPNGAGKTSLLEAAYVAATSRSFRTPRLEDCLAFDGAGFYIRLDLTAGTRLEMGWEPGRRRLAVDGSEVGVAEYLRHQPAVVWTQAAAAVLGGDPALGRRLLDRGVVARRPADLELLRRYRKVLAHKRELLSRGGSGGMAAWNDLVAEAGAAVVERRRETVDRLAEALGWVTDVCSLEAPPLELLYRPSPPEATEGAAALREALERKLPRERERGIPLVGPHRDRLRFRWRGRPVHRIASAGEQKGLGLLLAAAEARMLAQEERVPLVLLDDVDAELDGERLGRVWPAFAGAEQVLGSSNRPGIWKDLDATAKWGMSGGLVAPFAG